MKVELPMPRSMYPTDEPIDTLYIDNHRIKMKKKSDTGNVEKRRVVYDK